MSEGATTGLAIAILLSSNRLETFLVSEPSGQREVAGTDILYGQPSSSSLTAPRMLFTRPNNLTHMAQTLQNKSAFLNTHVGGHSREPVDDPV